MAKHEVVIHENKGATKEIAPYTGTYIPKETVRQDEYMGALAAAGGLPAVQMLAMIAGAFDAIQELERESLVRIHTDLGTICAVITGSFPTADAPFDPAKNTLKLTLRLDDDIRLSLADVVPTIVTDETVTKVRVDNVMDLVSPKPYNLIHGQNVYRVAGFNMVHEDEGATVFLQDAKGVTYSVVVDRVISKQLFEAHTAELLEPGDYKLVVKSRAGDPEGPLQTAFRKVKYLKVAPPVPAPIVEFVNGNPPGSVVTSENVTLGGAHLTGATVTLKYADDEGAPVAKVLEPMSATDEEIVLADNWYEGLPSSKPNIVFEVKTAGGKATIAADFEA